MAQALSMPVATSPRRARFPRLARMYGVWRQRQMLNRLDDAALRDIGLTRSEVDAEVRRPVWDAPQAWFL